MFSVFESRLTRTDANSASIRPITHTITQGPELITRLNKMPAEQNSSGWISFFFK